MNKIQSSRTQLFLRLSPLNMPGGSPPWSLSAILWHRCKVRLLVLLSTFSKRICSVVPKKNAGKTSQKKGTPLIFSTPTWLFIGSPFFSGCQMVGSKLRLSSGAFHSSGRRLGWQMDRNDSSSWTNWIRGINKLEMWNVYSLPYHILPYLTISYHILPYLTIILFKYFQVTSSDSQSWTGSLKEHLIKGAAW